MMLINVLFAKMTVRCRIDREENLNYKGTVYSQYASIKKPKYNFLESI